MKKAIQIIWSVAGVLLIVVFSLAISIGIDAVTTMRDVRELWSQVAVDDIRQTLDIIEKQLDKDILEAQIELHRGETPLEFTPENWQAFLDFCGRTGYVVSDDNWQRYRYGKLNP